MVQKGALGCCWSREQATAGNHFRTEGPSVLVLVVPLEDVTENVIEHPVSKVFLVMDAQVGGSALDRILVFESYGATGPPSPGRKTKVICRDASTNSSQIET